MIKAYFTLAKPGIIFGNAVTAFAGIALASRGSIDYVLLAATLLGLSCVVGSACVFNNCMDSEADKKMARTRRRPLVSGVISRRNAKQFGFCLGVAGTLILALWTNLLTALIAIGGAAVYLGLYSTLKYRSVHGTLIGSIAGGAPPLVGYSAVSGELDIGAWLLFLIVSLWQMPHFFAIALYRLEDYVSASIPVLPAQKGVLATKTQMFFYIVAFIAAALMLTFCGYTGYKYSVVVALLGVFWLCLSVQGFQKGSDQKWARQMFIFSLVIIMGLCTAISVDVLA